MYAHDLRCPTSLSAPQPVGVCDLCYRKWYLDDLRWQFNWRGDHLQNLRVRRCPQCLDVPSEFLRPIIIRGPEGSLRDPRPPQYAANAAAPSGPQLPFAPSWPGPDFPAEEALEGT